MPASAGIRFAGRVLRAVKRFTYGTHRTTAPEETIAWLRPHSRAAGVTRFADVTGLDRVGLPVVLSHRPNAPTLANAGGKGVSVAAATASAAMEAVEVFHAEELHLPVLHCTYTDLAREHEVIPIEMLPFAKRSLFRPGRPEHWVVGWDLLSGTEVAVPHAAVAVTPPPRRRPSTWMPFSMGTNGLAGGNHLLEAIEAALLEVIERDAVTCHALATTARGYPTGRVRLETIGDPLVQELVDRLVTAGVGLALYDCSSDTGVPCYTATIWDRWMRHLGRHSGFGAHLDPHVAMLRALTEAAQSRLVYIAGSRDDLFRRDQRTHQLFDTDEVVETLDSAPEVVDAFTLTSRAGSTFEADVAWILDRVRAVGCRQVIAVDLTREEIGVPVVKVVIPGFEGHMFDHYQPGPRALGIVEAARAEAGVM
ncbi:MAG: YcaO-like family protein [Actinomycetota bacterium]